MTRWFDRFKYNGLFIKMFIIMLVSITAVSIITTWTTINVSERVFMKTFSITNTKVISQINENLEAFNYAIVLATNQVSSSGAIREFLTESEGDSIQNVKAYYRMDNNMQRIVSVLDTYEVEVTVTGMNGRSYASSDRSLLKMSNQELKVHPITNEAHEHPRTLQYHIIETGYGGDKVIVMAKALMDRTADFIYGMIYFSISERDFSAFFDAYTSAGNEVVLLSQDGVILSSDRKSWLGDTEPDLLRYAQEMESKSLPYWNVDRMGKDLIVLSQYLPSLNSYVVNIIDKEIAIGQLTDMDAIIFSVVLIVAVALIIVFVISRRMTKSLTRLVKQISTISKYEFDHTVSVSGSYETRQLGQAFNSMLGELQVYVKRLIQTERQQRNAELEALQSQINPHFLYNTLASVKFMVQQGGKERAASTIHALISLLQNVVGDVSETISLSQELVNTKNYVLINQARYGDRIKMHYFVAPDCLGCHVPKLIIQPFIENAFFHAFHSKGEGSIYFMASIDGDTLLCEVVDDGDGFDMKEREQRRLQKTTGKRQLFTGIGVKNVEERLKLLYGEHYGVVIDSVVGEGTKVKIRIPIIKEQLEA